MADNEIEFDHVIVTCNGCGSERVVYPDRALEGVKGLKAWIDNELPRLRCPCGYPSCDLRVHMKGNPCLSCGEPKARQPGERCTAKSFHAAIFK